MFECPCNFVSELQLQTSVLSPWVLDKGYGPQFDDLDGISRHFATTASDPDYDIDDINDTVKSVHPDGLINHSVHEYKIHKLSTSVKTAL